MRFLDTRQLDNDSSGDVCFTDIGLSNTKTVDTSTKNIKRVVDSSVSLFADHVKNFLVTSSDFDLFFHFVSTENSRGCQLRSRGNFFECLTEKGHEVFRTGNSHLHGLLDCLIESGIRAVVCQTFYHVYHVNFHGHVHTTLQVQTEVQFQLLTFLVSEFG